MSRVAHVRKMQPASCVNWPGMLRWMKAIFIGTEQGRNRQQCEALEERAARWATLSIGDGAYQLAPGPSVTICQSE